MTKQLCLLAFLVGAACVAPADDDPEAGLVSAADEVEVELVDERGAATAQGEIQCFAWPCCGDGVCDGGEDHITCVADCAIVCITEPCCGDGVCERGERWTCPSDCASP